MIMDQMNLDYTKHCTTPFGAYVQANHESNPHNTNMLRTRDGIYLRRNHNFKGGHEVMDLNTGHVIPCRKVTEIPVTNVVIKAIEVMAHKQGFKNLKFKNRHGVIFHDADWLAGVDYEDEDAEEDECGKNADEDEEYEDSEDQDIELEEAASIDLERLMSSLKMRPIQMSIKMMEFIKKMIEIIKKAKRTQKLKG